MSTFKTAAFLLLLKYCFWSALCTLLQVVFSSAMKLLLDYNFRVLFTPRTKMCYEIIISTWMNLQHVAMQKPIKDCFSTLNMQQLKLASH